MFRHMLFKYTLNLSYLFMLILEQVPVQSVAPDEISKTEQAILPEISLIQIKRLKIGLIWSFRIDLPAVFIGKTAE